MASWDFKSFFFLDETGGYSIKSDFLKEYIT